MGRMIKECQASNTPLAYLSACQTAKSDEERPNEALTSLHSDDVFWVPRRGRHYVVDTRRNAPVVAAAFYQHLFRHGTERPFTPTDAAYELHLSGTGCHLYILAFSFLSPVIRWTLSSSIKCCNTSVR